MAKSRDSVQNKIIRGLVKALSLLRCDKRVISKYGHKLKPGQVKKISARRYVKKDAIGSIYFGRYGKPVKGRRLLSECK
jgi:hypothetical protein